MKERVVQVGNEFKPQYRGWFGWRDFKVNDDYPGGRRLIRAVKFSTLKMAVAFIEERSKLEVKMTEKVVWEQ